MKPGRLKILLYSPHQIYPYVDAIGLRTYNSLCHIALRHDVHLVLEFQAGEERKPLGPQNITPDWLQKTCAEVYFVPRETRRRKLRYGFLYKSDKLASVLNKLLSADQFDVIWGVSDDLPYYLDSYQNKNQTIVLDVHDCKDLAYRRMWSTAQGIKRRVKLVAKWALYRLYAHKYLRKIRHIVMVSPVDAASLLKILPHAEVTLIPMGADLAYFAPSRDYDRPSKATAVFMGVMSASHNIDAVKFFASQVMPQIQAEMPEFHFQVVGSSPPPEISDLTKNMSGITVTGYVDDVRPYLWEAGVFVVPMVSGTGIKTKVLEAWAAGCAVVSTSMGCQALKAQHEENILVADEPTEFARQVVRILNDSRLRDRLGAAGRKTVEEHYAWARQAEDFENLLRRVADKGSI